MRDFVVFYAWQSDRPTRFNKLFIRAALNLAARNISADPAANIRLRIDSDTEGVLGHVPVTETILKKIETCDAFVPDLTFVAETPDGKLIPNPNIMLEYGYALRARSYSIMIPVMNIAYGLPEKLPFDVRHSRYPLRFDLPPTAKNAERRKARVSLLQELERILRLMVAASSAVGDGEAMGKSRQEAARRILAPELKRTIDRALYIHTRAVVNFSCAFTENHIKPSDQKNDFLPYRPNLYPNAPEVRDLSLEYAAALSDFYDSLQSLADIVDDIWAREGELPENIFNIILHSVNKSLEFALICIEKFGLDLLYPPSVEAMGVVSSRIKRSLAHEANARNRHIAMFEAKAAKNVPKQSQRGSRV